MTSAASIRPKVLAALRRTGVVGVLTLTEVTLDPTSGSESRQDVDVNVWMARYSRGKSVATQQGFTTVEQSIVQVFALDADGVALSREPRSGDRVTYAGSEFTVQSVSPNEIGGALISFECVIGEA